MVQMGPTWGRHSEEWVLHFAFRPDDPERFNEDAIVPRLRELLRLPGLEPKVHKVSHWILDRIVAERWRIGDIFLAGDAAHRQPPTTGLGLNTGIQDTHNLAWKLALVLTGRAGDKLLDFYEAERIPVSAHGADWALLAFMNHFLIDAGIGLIPGAPVEANTAAFHALFSDTLMGSALRARAAEAIGTQRFEFQAHDVEIGYGYEAGAVIADGTPPPPRSATGTVYTPTTHPGYRLPHAWIDHDGQHLSTHDLAGRSGGFLLIAGRGGAGWCAAAEEAAEKFGVPVTVARIGAGCDYRDPEGTWAKACGISYAGAVLVRPDNHVAWRCQDAGERPGEIMTAVFAQILDR